MTLIETWRALERLVDDGQCKSIGLSDVNLDKLREIVAAARIKPAVVQVELHPYLPNGSCSISVASTGSWSGGAPLAHDMSPECSTTR